MLTGDATFTALIGEENGAPAVRNEPFEDVTQVRYLDKPKAACEVKTRLQTIEATIQVYDRILAYYIEILQFHRSLATGAAQVTDAADRVEELLEAENLKGSPILGGAAIWLTMGPTSLSQAPGDGGYYLSQMIAGTILTVTM